jgi:hypothetical protein
MARCNRLRLDVMFSLPSSVLSRDDDDLVRGRVGSLHRGETAARFLRARRPALVSLSPGCRRQRPSPGGRGPWASALVGHGHKVVEARTGDGVQEELPFRAFKGKRLSPD